MAVFSNKGIDIAFLDEGEGKAILLIHGFASTKEVNWVGTGWVKLLAASGYRVIALDNRGHGRSSSPHEASVYAPALMAGDALALLDHLGITAAPVIGYSIGARLALILAAMAPSRVSALVLGGVGLLLVEGMTGSERIAAALEAGDAAAVTDPVGKAYRSFADQTKSDRLALAACARQMRTPISREILASITQPTLIAVGTKDTGVGSPEALAALMPAARFLAIAERDHMSTVGDKRFKEETLAFLA